MITISIPEWFFWVLTAFIWIIAFDQLAKLWLRVLQYRLDKHVQKYRATFEVLLQSAVKEKKNADDIKEEVASMGKKK